jgi:glutathione S-transferase
MLIVSSHPEMPFGQVPLLEVDGQVICQSRVIEGFLARRFGKNKSIFYPKTSYFQCSIR